MRNCRRSAATTDTNSDRLFVYGTLRRTSPHPLARHLARQARYLGTAQVEGRLYRIKNYRGALPPDAAGGHIAGDLYRIPARSALWRQLDRYEGFDRKSLRTSEFTRRTICVTLPDGTDCFAWIYIVNRRVAEHARIVSGNPVNPAEQIDPVPDQL
jgi:gamma-glutamylcyclotransferase (GGCT)/AIG2-like uncharacterized protein YtfP